MNQVFVLQKILSGRLSMGFLLTYSISFMEMVFKSALVSSFPKRQGIKQITT